MQTIYTPVPLAAEFILFVVGCLITRILWNQMPGVIESVKKNPKRAAADIAAFAIVALFLIYEVGRESRGARADNITAEDQAPTGHLYAVARPPFDLPIKRGGLAE